MTLGQYITRARKKKKISRARLSEMMFLSQDTLRAYEKDIRRPRGETLQLLIKLLNLDHLTIYVLFMEGEMGCTFGPGEGNEILKKITNDELLSELKARCKVD